MKLTKKHGRNEYVWEGLTLGKLMAIRETLRKHAEQHGVSTLTLEVFRFLELQELDKEKVYR